MKTKNPPAFIWADYDPHANRTVRWAFYNTKADQRSNRPDLKPIKLAVRRAPVGPQI
jgi:hypothetical protein